MTKDNKPISGGNKPESLDWKKIWKNAEAYSEFYDPEFYFFKAEEFCDSITPPELPDLIGRGLDLVDKGLKHLWGGAVDAVSGKALDTDKVAIGPGDIPGKLKKSGNSQSHS